MRSFLFAVLPVLLCAFIMACESTGRPVARKGDQREKEITHDDLAYRLFEVRMKSEEIPADALKNFLGKKLDNLNGHFDPLELIRLFPRVTLKPGGKPVYYYEGSWRWDGQGKVMVIDEGKPVPLTLPGMYRKYVAFEKTPEGALQFALLYEELGLLTLKQHLNYSQTWFLPSYGSFLRICSTKVRLDWIGEIGYWYRNLLPTPPDEGKHLEFWTKLEKADALFKPRVVMEGPVAGVSLHRFSPWGGVYRAEYHVHMETGEISQVAGEWSFPIYRTGEYIIPFHCGVMF